MGRQQVVTIEWKYPRATLGPWRLPLLVFAVALSFMTLGPASLRPVLTGDAALDRFIGFLLAGIVLGLAYPSRRARAALGLITVAAVLEAGQLVAPGRDASLLDALIKAGGGVVGIAVTSAAWPVGQRARRGAFVRAGMVATVTLLIVAATIWWVRTPVLAVRKARVAIIADAMAPGLDRPQARWLRAVLAAYPAPTIDIWDRAPGGFQATLRDGRTAFVVLRFERVGLCWRLVAARQPRALKASHGPVIASVLAGL